MPPRVPATRPSRSSSRTRRRVRRAGLPGAARLPGPISGDRGQAGIGSPRRTATTPITSDYEADVPAGYDALTPMCPSTCRSGHRRAEPADDEFGRPADDGSPTPRARHRRRSAARPQHGGEWEGGEWTGSHRAIQPGAAASASASSSPWSRSSWWWPPSSCGASSATRCRTGPASRPRDASTARVAVAVIADPSIADQITHAGQEVQRDRRTRSATAASKVGVKPADPTR